MSKQNEFQTSPVILINTLSVSAENQEALLSILKEGAESVMPKHSGYLGSAIYKGKDGKSMVVLAQWKSPKDIEAVRSNPDNENYLLQIQELAKASPSIYELFFTHNGK